LQAGQRTLFRPFMRGKCAVYGVGRISLCKHAAL